MFFVAIVEDEKEAADVLTEYLEKYGMENGLQFNCTRFEDAESFLTGYGCQYDLVFMDIEMPYINGLSAAHRLREADDSVALVFVTNLARYAINGYEVNALDYILKPFSYQSFALKMRKVVNYCRRMSENSILITFKGNAKRLPLNEINYVEISAHNIIFHTTEGPVQSYGTLKDVSCELDGKGFALCNRCYLVNLRRVKYIDGYTVKVGDEELQISRPQKKSFAEAFKKFIRTVRDE